MYKRTDAPNHRFQALSDGGCSECCGNTLAETGR